jgi:transcription initiation factor TFIIE subunit alpha
MGRVEVGFRRFYACWGTGVAQNILRNNKIRRAICADSGGYEMQLTKMKETQDDTSMVVTELVGAHAMPIIDFLKGKEKISEFIIAEELNMEINETRNVLYKLLEHNIVSFLRKKDKIKGWYICYWDFNPHMVPQLKYKILQGKRDRMVERLKQEEQGQYYICKFACSRMTFEHAIEQNFKCNECGTIMQEQDNTRTKEFLRERITELEGQVKAAEPRRRIAQEAPAKVLAKKTPVKKIAVKARK